MTQWDQSSPLAFELAGIVEERICQLVDGDASDLTALDVESRECADVAPGEVDEVRVA